MLSSTPDLQAICTDFLQQTALQRLVLLKQIGLARYDVLTKMRLTEANVACVMRFFKEPKLVKFPQLQGADLSDLILNNANFIRGKLENANLTGSSLMNADLIFANFTKANLTSADLTGATLNETIWVGTLVAGCKLGTGIGLTTAQRKDLDLRGAKFDLRVN